MWNSPPVSMLGLPPVVVRLVDVVVVAVVDPLVRVLDGPVGDARIAVARHDDELLVAVTPNDVSRLLRCLLPPHDGRGAHLAVQPVRRLGIYRLAHQTVEHLGVGLELVADSLPDVRELLAGDLAEADVAPYALLRVAPLAPVVGAEVVHVEDHFEAAGQRRRARGPCPAHDVLEARQLGRVEPLAEAGLEPLPSEGDAHEREPAPGEVLEGLC